MAEKNVVGDDQCFSSMHIKLVMSMIHFLWLILKAAIWELNLKKNCPT
jgi:hypothetical protein